MRALWRITLAVAGIVPLVSCEAFGPQDCTAIALWGLNVTVVSALDGSPVSDGLRVVIRDGAYVEELQGYGNFRQGASERGGTYDLTVEAPGFESVKVNRVRVGEDRCHVITRDVTIELEPNA